MYNYDFRYFSNRKSSINSWSDYRHPDGFVINDNGTNGHIGWDSSKKCVLFRTSSNGSGFRQLNQSVHEFVNWKRYLCGKTVSFVFNIKGRARVRVSDGISSVTKNTANNGSIEHLELQIAVSPSASKLIVIVESSISSNTIEIYSIYGNRGSVAIESLPCIVRGVIGENHSYDITETPPIGEFERNGMEIPIGYSRLETVLNGKFGRGPHGRSRLKDGRGLFERQWAHGSGQDPDRSSRTNRGDGVFGDHVGTLQGDELKSHRHTTLDRYGKQGSENPPHLPNHVNIGGNADSGAGYQNYQGEQKSFYSGGSETRPKNIYLLKTTRWC